ncbi:hypothetical protein [Actinomyces culturomici]|uniref:hypothetical protein n=1 Tax=Actinomyces culturomici TaxID=1926276 RepID=UPI001356F536|nr:hypothetical protein [Actinomyces culturomici]
MKSRKVVQLRAGAEAAKALALSKEIGVWQAEIVRRVRSFWLSVDGLDASAADVKRELEAVVEVTRSLRTLTFQLDAALSEGFCLFLKGDDTVDHANDGQDLMLPAVGEELVDLVVERSGQAGDLRVGGVAVDGDRDGRVVLDPFAVVSVVVPASEAVGDHAGNGGEDPEGLDAGLHADAVDIDLNAVEDFVEVHESSSSVERGCCGDGHSTEGDTYAGEPVDSPFADDVEASLWERISCAEDARIRAERELDEREERRGRAYETVNWALEHDVPREVIERLEETARLCDAQADRALGEYEACMSEENEAHRALIDLEEAGSSEGVGL